MGLAGRGMAGRWGRRFGITTRLMAAHTLLLVAVIGAVVYQSDRVITQRLVSSLNTDLVDEVPEFVTAAGARPDRQGLAAFAVHYVRSHAPTRLFAVRLRANTTGGATESVSSVGAGFLLRLQPVTGWLDRPPVSAQLVTVHTAHGSYRVMGAPLVLGGTRLGTFVAAANLASLNPDRTDQIALAVGEGLAALVAALAGGLLLLRRVLRTVNKVTVAAEEARGGDLSQRLRYTGPDDEVGRLARTVDGMLAQLDTSFSAQRRLLADVSHQLRTPLTVARGHLEVLARSLAGGRGEEAETVVLVIDELTAMSTMVERLLLLGQAMEPDFLLEEDVDLPALFEEVDDAARAMADRQWEFAAVPDATVRLDRSKLRGALLNLVDNAVKATAPLDRIRIGARVGRDLVIEVADTGRGISAEDQRVVFDRFRRSASSTYAGSGLGLAIAKAVAEAHGGRIELTSAVGEGTQVCLVLPADRVRAAAEPPVAPVGAG